MKKYAATVLGRRQLSAHLVTVTLGGLEGYQSTGIPDEYLRLVIPPVESDPVELDPVEPEVRVYTVSDHRIVDGDVRVDLDIALHDRGVGSDWARTCEPGDRVEVTEPHGLYAGSPDVGWQLLVADITGVPAVARILRGLRAGQRAEVVLVVTDPGDEIALPSAADVDVTWHVVARETDVSGALELAVTSRDLPTADRYVWLAGEARASRAVRRHLRRELSWPQGDFYTCGYWQIDAEVWKARYEEVQGEVQARAAEAQRRVGDDEGAYLDALDDLYESVGL